MLGLNISSSGYICNVKDCIQKGTTAFTKLYRLGNMPINITHLVKALVLPVIDYPPTPTHTLSNAQLKSLRKIQNKALTFATNQRYHYILNTEQIHE